MAGFVIGVAVVLLAPYPGAKPLWLLLAALVPLAVAGRSWRPAGLVGLGVVWALLWCGYALEARLPAELEGRDLVLTGRVIGLPESDDARQRFLVRPERLEGLSGERLPRRVRLSWYGGARTLRPGEHWRWTVRLRRPRGLMNPVAFDYEQWLFTRRIDAVGYVRDGGSARRLSGPGGLHWLRDRWARGMREVMGGGAATEVAVALTLGDRRGFDNALWETLRATGTTHLVAISGLHVGLMAALGFLAGRWSFARLPLARRVPAPVGGAALALVLAGSYALLAGLSLPTLRALIMLCVALLAVVGRRRAVHGRALALAAVAVLLIDPFAMISPGFWLSFGAVAVLLGTAAGGRGDVPLYARLGRAQLAVTIGLVPLLAAWFRHVSVLAAPVNLAAVPLVATVVVPAVLLGFGAWLLVPSWGGAVLQGVGLLLGPLLSGLERIGSMPWAGLTLPALPPWLLAAVALGVGLMLLPAGTPGRRLVLPLVFLPLLWAPPPAPFGEARLTFLDVGQGTAVVVETRNHVLVYDTGPRWGGSGSAAEVALIPYLRERGITRVDRLLVSHGDSDHAGGLEAMLDAVAVDRVRMGEPRPGDRRMRACRRGQGWRWDGVVFRVLWPPDGSLSGNASSCVLQIRAGEATALLTGDIDAAVEGRLRGPPLRATELLLVPHHGSASSSSPGFIRHTAPSFAVITAGHRNAYGLPAEEVVLRYRRQGSRVLNTASDGALVFRLSPHGAALLESRRHGARRLYHAAPETGPVSGAAANPL